MKKQFRQMVAYLLEAESTKDKELIDNYTDTMFFGAEEYALKKAIEFGNWLKERGYEPSKTKWVIWDSGEPIAYSTSELYKEFLKK